MIITVDGKNPAPGDMVNVSLCNIMYMVFIHPRCWFAGFLNRGWAHVATNRDPPSEPYPVEGTKP